MKIAVFAKRFPLPSETFVYDQVIALNKLGEEVDLITTEVNSDLIRNEESNTINIDSISIPEHSKKELLKFLFKNSLKIASDYHSYKKNLSIIIDRNLTIREKIILTNMVIDKRKMKKYKSILVHFGNNGYFILKMRELKIIDGPILPIFHGYELSCYAEVEKNKESYMILSKSCELLVPISELWKSELIKITNCEPNKICVHKIGIDIEKFKYFSNDKIMGKTIKIIQVGRLTEKKAVINSIKAVIKLRRNLDIELTIIGDGGLYDDCCNLIEDEKANSYIFLKGSCTPEVVNYELSYADVFILPSVRSKNGDMEGIPVSLMEAMIKGLIVISTRHSGIPELIEDRINGYLVEENNIQDIVDVVYEIIDSEPDELENMRKCAKEKVEKYHNNNLLIRDLVEIINKESAKYEYN